MHRSGLPGPIRFLVELKTPHQSAGAYNSRAHSKFNQSDEPGRTGGIAEENSLKRL